MGKLILSVRCHLGSRDGMAGGNKNGVIPEPALSCRLHRKGSFPSTLHHYFAALPHKRRRAYKRRGAIDMMCHIPQKQSGVVGILSRSCVTG
jgi:hypothetical protein